MMRTNSQLHKATSRKQTTQFDLAVSFLWLSQYSISFLVERQRIELCSLAYQTSAFKPVCYRSSNEGCSSRIVCENNLYRHRSRLTATPSVGQKGLEPLTPFGRSF